MTIRCAHNGDISRLVNFLDRANLNTEGIKESIDYFLIMENDLGEIKATLGIEPLGKVGLLRSLVVATSVSEQELFILFEQILMLARDKRLHTLYLASNKKNSLEFFHLMGFVREEKTDLPAELIESNHVKYILTVDNSFFLKLTV